MKELIGICKDCTGCQRLEDEKFKGVEKCEWKEKIQKNSKETF